MTHSWIVQEDFFETSVDLQNSPDMSENHHLVKSADHKTGSEFSNTLKPFFFLSGAGPPEVRVGTGDPDGREVHPSELVHGKPKEDWTVDGSPASAVVDINRVQENVEIYTLLLVIRIGGLWGLI